MMMALYRGRNMSHCVIQCCTTNIGSRIAQSVQRLVKGWTVRGSNPGGGEIFRTRPDRL